MKKKSRMKEKKATPGKCTDSNGISIEPTDVQAVIKKTLNNILNLDNNSEIDIDAYLGDIGITSLMLVTFIDELNNIFNLKLSETVVFDYPNIHVLSRHVVDQLKQTEIVKATLPSKSDTENNKTTVSSSTDVDIKKHIRKKISLESLLLDVIDGNIDIEDAVELIGL